MAIFADTEATMRKAKSTPAVEDPTPRPVPPALKDKIPLAEMLPGDTVMFFTTALNGNRIGYVLPALPGQRPDRHRVLRAPPGALHGEVFTVADNNITHVFRRPVSPDAQAAYDFRVKETERLLEEAERKARKKARVEAAEAERREREARKRERERARSQRGQRPTKTAGAPAAPTALPGNWEGVKAKSLAAALTPEAVWAHYHWVGWREAAPALRWTKPRNPDLTEDAEAKGRADAEARKAEGA